MRRGLLAGGRGRLRRMLRGSPETRGRHGGGVCRWIWPYRGGGDLRRALLPTQGGASGSSC